MKAFLQRGVCCGPQHRLYFIPLVALLSTWGTFWATPRGKEAGGGLVHPCAERQPLGFSPTWRKSSIIPLPWRPWFFVSALFTQQGP